MQYKLLLALFCALIGSYYTACGSENTDTSCTPESDDFFCSRYHKDCGDFTETDNCDSLRTVYCGTCTDGLVCGIGVANMCGMQVVASGCGNNHIDTNEQCDGTNLNNATCNSLGYTDGSLVCNNSTCTFDVSQCTSETAVSETLLYDGESITFNSYSAWDSHNSSMEDSTADPFSGTNHIRATINVADWWGGVAYLPTNELCDLFISAENLTFQAKANQSVTMQIAIADTSTSTDPTINIDLTTEYQLFTIPIDNLDGGGVSLNEIWALVFAISVGNTTTYTVDIDDIKLTQGASPSALDEIPANDSNIQLIGRWDKTDPVHPTNGWNSSYIRTAFTGPHIGIQLTDGNNNWTYSIDDGNYQTLVTTSASSYTLASNLPTDTTHTLIIARRTESYFGDITFHGFEVAQGYTLLAPTTLPNRRIEFIGDSITAGYGNEGSTQNRSTQNGYMAFGPQTARLLNAQWHVEAISGIGMYRNYGDNSSPPTQSAMPAYYEGMTADDTTASWDFTTWIPDAVVIFLGTNDFSHDDLDVDAYKAAYTDFLLTVRTHYPNAHIFCLSFFYGTATDDEDEWEINRGYVENIVTNFATAYSDLKVYHLDPVGDEAGADNVTTRPWITLGTSDDIGDWTHPSVSGHTKIAEKLSAEIEDKLGW